MSETVRPLARIAAPLGALLLILVLGVQPAAAQINPGVGALLSAGEEEEPAAEPSGERDLIQALEDSVAEGAEIIIIRRPSADEGSEAATPGAQAPRGDGYPSGDDYARLASGESVIVEMARNGIERFFIGVADRVRAADALHDEMLRQLAARSPTREAAFFIDVALDTVFYLAVSTVAVILVFGVIIVRPWFLRQKSPNPQTIEEKLPILLLRAGLGIFGACLAVICAIVLGAFFGDVGHVVGDTPQHEATQATLIVIFGAYLAVRLVAIGWRVVLAPYLMAYRIPKLRDGEARRLFAWLFATGALALIFQAYCVWLEALRLSPGFHALVSSGLTLVVVLLNILFVLFNGRTVSRAIRGGRPRSESSWPARWASLLWGPATIVYSIAAWVVMTTEFIEGEAAGAVPLIVGAYVVMLSAFAVYALVSAIISWVFGAAERRRRAAAVAAAAPTERAAFSSSAARGGQPVEEATILADLAPGEADGPDEPAEGAPTTADEGKAARPAATRRPGGMRTARDLGRRVATILAIAAGFIAFLRIWSTETAALEVTPFVDGLIDISVVVLFGYIAYHALRIWIDQRIEAEGGYDAPPEPGEGEGGAGASRLATLLPLFRNFILTIITITVVLIVALELGVNVAPLFAGAGIVGLALGFGAQALVRDILSGAFFLIDDAFRKGEYVDLGTVKGVVERISVRSFQLRHHLGYLHTVPFGEIQSLTNYSRDWVVMKLPLRLTYDTDAEAVRKKIKKLGEELLQDPVHGPKFLQPLKSQGLVQMDESAMIMRVKFMTKPGEQWVLRKVILAKIRDLFEREGIKFAHREVTVRVAEGPAPGYPSGPQPALEGAGAGQGGAPLTEAQKRAIAGAAAPTLAQRQDAIGDDPLDGGD